MFALAKIPEQFRSVFKVTGQRNANFWVAQKSISLAEQGNCRDSAFFKGGFQAGAGILIGDATQVGQYQCPQRADAGLVKMTT